MRRRYQVPGTLEVPGTWKSACLFMGSIIIALALRLFRLGGQSLWYDEGVSFYLTQLSLPEMLQWTAQDIQPPLYYLLLRGWVWLFGVSEFALRFPSLIFGLLTVPLFYMLGRKLFDESAGVLAAYLVALSPLYLWYSQEARMYTLLTFLGLLSAYLSLLIAEREEKRPRRLLWAALVLMDVLALYTHYFAFFLIVFQALWLSLAAIWRKRSYLWVEGAFALAGLFLAYLPWMPYVFLRYRADVSYWRGALKLDEALRHILISFSLGETVLEEIGWKLALGYLALFVYCLLLIAYRASRIVHPPTSNLQLSTSIPFLLLYLSLPLVGVLALVYYNPKFSPRYLMFASPPFLLIIAAGLASSFRDVRGGAIRRVALRLIAGLSLLFVLGTMAYADYNNFFDIRFIRPDFRGAINYLKGNIGPKEAIILLSGHMYPIFTYYYEGDNWHPIPGERILSTERVINYSVAEDLNRALAGASGAWLVLWQDEVVDPNGFVVEMLSEAGRKMPVEASFYHVRLRHYVLTPGARFSSAPRIDHPLDVNFGGEIDLLGYNLSSGPAPLKLFWRARHKLKKDYKISFRLLDAEGHSWHNPGHDRRPASELFPTTRWQPGEIFFGRYALPFLPGTPPGEYQVEVLAYSEGEPEALDALDAAGAFRGKSVSLGAISLAEPQPATFEELKISGTLQAEMAGQIALLGYEIGRTKAQPGDLIPLTLFWKALKAPAENFSLLIRLTDEGGRAIGEEEFSLAGPAYPTGRWRAGEILRGQYDFLVPIEAPPGLAHLWVALAGEDGQILGELLSLARLEVERTERVFTPPPMQYIIKANFGGLATLLGADLEPERARPGGTLRIKLYWQTRGRMGKSYTVFTHLLDAEGKVRGQHDGIPAVGNRPTTGWVPREIIADEHELQIAPDAPPGRYILEVGLYDANDPAFPRLPMLDESGEAIDTRVIVAEVEL
ncbi:MAG: glycosyltransferase family 39 protein [Anaerolineae bacterium]